MKRTAGFIGCGNMAQPIIRAVLSEGIFESVRVFDTDSAKLRDFCASSGAAEAASAAECAECDAVFLCVKPQVLPSVAEEIASDLSGDKLVVSIAAGVTTEKISALTGGMCPVARIFPNLNASVKAASSAYTLTPDASDGDALLIKSVCESFGEATRLDEKDFPAFGVLCGCAPAYTFMYINALAKAGLDAGLDEKTAIDGAVQTVLGSAKLLKELGGEADEWVKKVCSPGGTTIEGVKSLDSDGLSDIIKTAFGKSMKRDFELSKG